LAGRRVSSSYSRSASRAPSNHQTGTSPSSASAHFDRRRWIIGTQFTSPFKWGMACFGEISRQRGTSSPSCGLAVASLVRTGTSAFSRTAVARHPIDCRRCASWRCQGRFPEFDCCLWVSGQRVLYSELGRVRLLRRFCLPLPSSFQSSCSGLLELRCLKQ